MRNVPAPMFNTIRARALFSILLLGGSAFAPTAYAKDFCKDVLGATLDTFGPMRSYSKAPEVVDDLIWDHVNLIKYGFKKAPAPIAMKFVGLPENFVVYNPAGFADITVKGVAHRVFIARVEPTHGETGMFMGLFTKDARGNYTLANDTLGLPESLRRLAIQDPFFEIVVGEHGREFILGGVAVREKRVNGAPVINQASGEPELEYSSVFYRDKGLGFDHLEKFTSGIPGTKDDRFVGDQEFKPTGWDDVFINRPQGDKGGFDPFGKKGERGKLGMFFYKALSEIDPKRIADSIIIPNMLGEAEWLGANKAKWGREGLFGKIKVLGHYAKFQPAYKDGLPVIVNGKHVDERVYVAVAFVLDPKSRTVSRARVLATSSDLPPSLQFDSKRWDLEKVFFPTDFVQDFKTGLMTLVYGAMDSNAGVMKVLDPWLAEEYPALYARLKLEGKIP